MKDAFYEAHAIHWRRLWLPSALAFGIVLALPHQAAATLPTLTVNSNGDGNTGDALLTLREAIAITNNGTGGGVGLGRTMTNGEKTQTSGCTCTGNDGGDPSNPTLGAWTITGGCGAGSFESIRFAPSVTQIFLNSGASSLSINDDGTWIDGSGLQVPWINAINLTVNTFVISASHVTISHLSLVNGYSGTSDIAVNSGVDSRIAYNYIGMVPGANIPEPCSVVRNGGNGVIVSGDHSGSNAPNGAAVYIYGNVIGCHVGNGIFIFDSDYVFAGIQPDGTTADGNWIGLSPSNVALPNAQDGIYLEGAAPPNTAQYNMIANNIISGNGHSGIEFRFSPGHNEVRGNKIGTNTAGTAALANGWHGVEIDNGAAIENTIGGDTAARRNIISGNGQNGVFIHDGPTHNHIVNNLIGLNESRVAIPNGWAGVAIIAANDNYVGIDHSSPSPSVFQNISGNNREGIYIANGIGNQIYRNNFIGVTPDLDDMMPLGNGREGIKLDAGTMSTLVEPMIVDFNGLATGLPGIAVLGVSYNNWIKPYAQIGGNGGLPIDLGDDGATRNGTHSGTGPDNWLNYPVITTAAGSAIAVHACVFCQVRLYRAIGNPAAAGGGGNLLGMVLTDASGNATVDLATLGSGYPNLRAGDVTLTAYQNSDGTSEMSPRPQVYLPLLRK